MATQSTAWHKARTCRPLRVLVDMDCVMCDLESQALTRYRQKYPEEPYIPLEDRNTFYLRDQYSKIRDDLGDKVGSVIQTPGFYRSLEPIEGAIEAVKEISGMENVEVFVCTSPDKYLPSSPSEKFEWIQHHLGRDWLAQMIIATDKTMVQGDILIDDRPIIRGSLQKPSWDHILFTTHHNKHLDMSKLRCAHRLENWTDTTGWKMLVLQYQKKLQH